MKTVEQRDPKTRQNSSFIKNWYMYKLGQIFYAEMWTSMKSESKIQAINMKFLSIEQRTRRHKIVY
jgi:hypothetical protein